MAYKKQKNIAENAVSKKYYLMYNKNNERRWYFEYINTGTPAGFRTSGITPVYR